MVRYPARLAFVLAWGTGLFVFSVNDWPIALGSVIGLATGMLLYIVCTAFLITRWRIWAFGNVIDVVELKKAATDEALIGKEGEWDERIEMRSAAEKAAWQKVQQRFDEPYVFIDDLSVGNETEIFRRKERLFALSAKGITTDDTGLVEWDHVDGDRIYRTSGKNGRPILEFGNRGDTVAVDVGGMGITRRQLRHLLFVYRRRYEQSKKA